MDDGSSRSSENGSQVIQLNDSIYELHKPAGWPSMQVLFFHGFQLEDYENAHLTTWQSGDESCVWPQAWLVDEFPTAHILVVSYQGGLKNRKEAGNMDFYIIRENIMSDILQENIGQEVGCPVLLVGHSFGGLVIKDLCLHAHGQRSLGKVEEYNFLQNVKGLFFYSTPHHGITSRLAERFVSKGFLLDYVKTLSKHAARMNNEFEHLQKYYHTWQTAGIGEILPTKLSLLEISVVVEEASSRYGDDFELVSADHISICRPMSRKAKGFYSLTRFLGKFRNRFGAELPAGAQLPPGESLVSAQKKYTFTNRPDGNLVVLAKDGRLIWESGTWKKGRGAGFSISAPRGDLKLLGSGNLVLYNTGGTGLPVWATMSQGNRARPHKLVMQDNGSLVIYDADLLPIWSNVTDTSSGLFIKVDGKDVLPSAVTWLEPYHTLVSSNQMYTLINQGDGNLCLYNPSGNHTWAAGTSSTDGAGRVYMQSDGNLVLYHDTKGDDAPRWASHTSGRGTGPFKLVMQDDGNLVIYGEQGPTWATNTR